MSEAGAGPSLKARLLALLAVVTLLFILPGATLLWMTAVPGRSFSGPLPPLTPGEQALAARLERHVRAIARGPRNVAHPEALEAAATYIEAALAASGYEVRRQPYDVVRNIEAVLEPAEAGAQTLVVGAHYDSWGPSPGANDNGSGTAAVLELARTLARLKGRSGLRIRFVGHSSVQPSVHSSVHSGPCISIAHFIRH